MIKLGQMQTLEIKEFSPNGVYLKESGKKTDEKVLLPRNQVPEDSAVGDNVTVFIYKDSEDRPIATTTIPYLMLDELAVLKVLQTTSIGAFLDWGLLKDLFLPFKEQTYPVKEGDDVLVRLYLDKSSRLCASMKVYDYLDCDSPYKKDDHVTGIVYDTSDNFGLFVAVDNKYSALIPKKELCRNIKPGTTIEARVFSVRSDGKLNLSLRDKAHIQMSGDSDMIYELLSNTPQGFLPYHDKSDPEDIKKVFGLSKAAFKRAIGRLWKEQKIDIKENGIYKKD